MKNTRESAGLESFESSEKTARALARFVPLNRLSEEQRVVVAARGSLRQVPAGQPVLQGDAPEQLDYFLLQGKVRLRASDGRETEIAAGTEAARRALSSLLARKVDVIARADCVFLVIEQNLLATLLKEAPVEQEPDAAEPLNAEDQADNPAYAAVMAFQEALRNNRLQLPSLPDVAMKVREAAQRDEVTNRDLGLLIAEDPALAVKIVHVANSPFYRGFRPVESCDDAIARLGRTTVTELITIYTLREMFRSRHAVLQARYVALWQHVTEVGVFAHVLARKTRGLRPDQCMLAGIVHDIGAIPVILYADAHPELLQEPDVLEDLIQELQGEIGSELLQRWGFPAAICEAARQADHYAHESGREEATVADAVIVAQWHAMIGKPGQTLPPLSSVPAFPKLAGGTLSPARSMEILDQAQEEIAQMRALLA